MSLNPALPEMRLAYWHDRCNGHPYYAPHERAARAARGLKIQACIARHGKISYSEPSVDIPLRHPWSKPSHLRQLEEVS